MTRYDVTLRLSALEDDSEISVGVRVRADTEAVAVAVASLEACSELKRGWEVLSVNVAEVGEQA